MANASGVSSGGLIRRETVMRLVTRSVTERSPGEGGNQETAMTGTYWSVNHVWLGSGRKPSFALAKIPLAASAVERMPSVFNSSLIKKLKGGTPARVEAEFGGKTFTIMTGVIVNVHEDMAEDTATVMIQDGRYLLEVPIIGSFWATGSGEPQYVFSRPCLMNPEGLPNCTMQGTSNQLCFCPPNMGLKDGEKPPKDPVTGKACYWTPGRAIEYFQQRTANDAPAIAPFLCKVPTSVIFSPGLGSALQDTTYDGSDAGPKARVMNFDGYSLLDALSTLCEYAGPYALSMDYDSQGWGGTLTIVPTKFAPSKSTPAYDALIALAGDASTVLTPAAASGGSMETTVLGRYTRVAVVGGPHQIERRLYNGGSGDKYLLEPAWTTEEQEEFCNFLNNPPNGLTDPVQIFRIARQKWPKVFTAYRIKDGWDFQAGSSRNGKPLARIPRAPAARLFTSFITDTDSDLMTRLKYPLPIGIEIALYAEGEDGTNWQYQEKTDGLEIDARNGIVWLEGLCKEVGGRSSTWSGDLRPPEQSPGSYIRANRIRATFLMPTDTRLYAAYCRATDTAAAGGNVDVHPDAFTPAAEWEKGVSRVAVVDVGDKYQFVERRDSYPLPEAVGNESGYGQPINDVPLDDTEHCKSHAKRVHADLTPPATTTRVEYPHVFTAIIPGMPVGKLKISGSGERVCNAVVVSVEFLSDDKSGEKTVVGMN